MASWSGGLAEWTDGDTAFLSVAFTWRLDEAYSKAVWYKSQGYRVQAGGPGVFTRKKYLADVAEVGGDLPDAIVRHNPLATRASTGCSVGCWFCIVPKMEGRSYTELPDFPVRPILCDNNLSALDPRYQDYIVERYRAEGVDLLDANSGFEPRTFDPDVFARWDPVLKGPWRFAYDDAGDRPHVRRVLRMLEGVRLARKRVYVLIGNEPFEDCMRRIDDVIAWGGDPYVQPFIKLNALDKAAHVRHDWTRQKLIDVSRWCNRWLWKQMPFSEYRGSVKSAPAPEQEEDLFAHG